MELSSITLALTHLELQILVEMALWSRGPVPFNCPFPGRLTLKLVNQSLSHE
jgi:hypothetical protein